MERKRDEAEQEMFEQWRRERSRHAAAANLDRLFGQMREQHVVGNEGRDIGMRPRYIAAQEVRFHHVQGLPVRDQLRQCLRQQVPEAMRRAIEGPAGQGAPAQDPLRGEDEEDVVNES